MATASGLSSRAADDDRRGGDVPRPGDERGVRPLAGPGGPAEPDELAGEPEVVAAVLLLQVVPDGREDEVGVLDLQARVGSGGTHPGWGWGGHPYGLRSGRARGNLGILAGDGGSAKTGHLPPPPRFGEGGSGRRSSLPKSLIWGTPHAPAALTPWPGLTDEPMSRPRAASRLATTLLLVLVGAGLNLPFLGRAGLWDMDEGLNAEAARQMAATGDWVVPTFNGELRSAKPVLLYWLEAAAYRAFGVSEFAARLPQRPGRDRGPVARQRPGPADVRPRDRVSGRPGDRQHDPRVPPCPTRPPPTRCCSPAPS